MKIHSDARSALSILKSGQRVFVHGGAATPVRLLEALDQWGPSVPDIELVHLHTIGPAPRLRTSAFFIGPNLRPRFGDGQVDYLPCLLSEIPRLLRSRTLPLDVALIHVSPPDAHGFCTLGTSVDIAHAATDSAPLIIAQINPQMPRVHGDGFIHVSRIAHAIEVNDPLPEEKLHAPTEVERKIAQQVAGLIEDGSTLQMGIGAIPDAVLGALKHHRHLGIHTEMWSDGALELIRSGAVDNSLKKNHPGKTVSGFVIGSRALYDFIDDNPSVVQLDIEYVNRPANIARNPKVVAINSAVEVDLTGQVCADSVGPRIISGAGGQMDFIRGAALSEGGKPIIAITSRSAAGHPRIVPMLREGAGVVTTRAHIHYVVTEYGVADLQGKTLAQRAKLLTAISHPDDRDRLTRAFRSERGPSHSVR